MKKLGPVQQKILMLLIAGAALSLTKSPKDYYRIVGLFGREWKRIGKAPAERSIAKLYRSKMIDLKQQPDGTWQMVLTDRGRKRVLYYKIDSMKIARPKRWDRKWRLVLFDIPEKQKGSRDAFRAWIKKLGFIELQKSVFVLPYDCRNEFDFMVEFLSLRSHVRFVIADEIDNETYLKRRFRL